MEQNKSKLYDENGTFETSLHSSDKSAVGASWRLLYSLVSRVLRTEVDWELSVLDSFIRSNPES